jgi:hypothetical protein
MATAIGRFPDGHVKATKGWITYKMRSSKSRSRSKSNRNNNRSAGNIINRVFDSSGPEGKVRGTPQQIIDKYNQLARDSQLSNDRVATENFQQHAEHYLRLLSEAQKEMEARREQQEKENRERQAERDRERAQRQEREAAAGGGGEQPNLDDPASQAQPEVIEAEAGESSLVETPEDGGKPKRSRRSPKPRSKKPDESVAAPEETEQPAAE